MPRQHRVSGSWISDSKTDLKIAIPASPLSTPSRASRRGCATRLRGSSRAIFMFCYPRGGCDRYNVASQVYATGSSWPPIVSPIILAKAGSGCPRAELRRGRTSKVKGRNFRLAPRCHCPQRASAVLGVLFGVRNAVWARLVTKNNAQTRTEGRDP